METLGTCSCILYTNQWCSQPVTGTVLWVRSSSERSPRPKVRFNYHLESNHLLAVYVGLVSCTHARGWVMVFFVRLYARLWRVPTPFVHSCIFCTTSVVHCWLSLNADNFTSPMTNRSEADTSMTGTLWNKLTAAMWKSEKVNYHVVVDMLDWMLFCCHVATNISPGPRQHACCERYVADLCILSYPIVLPCIHSKALWDNAAMHAGNVMG